MGINREKGTVAHVTYWSFLKLFVPVSLSQAGPRPIGPDYKNQMFICSVKKNGDFISSITKKNTAISVAFIVLFVKKCEMMISVEYKMLISLPYA